MENVTLNITQAIQMAAIGPCVFIIIYLFFSARKKSYIIIPVLFFISLLCGFLLPVLFLFPQINDHILRSVLIFNEHLAPELSFLLILQFIFQRPPPIIYWLILALPFIGGGYLLYLTIIGSDICIFDDVCIASEKIMILYRVIGASLVFMLLIPIMKRTRLNEPDVLQRKNKYWLIIMLIAYNLLILALSLIFITDNLDPSDKLFIKTMLGVTFIYLVLSSLFRVFNKNLGIKTITNISLSERDYELVDRINRLMSEEKIYRNMDFNRATLSDIIGVTEQHLSRLINRALGKSFSTLINEYRIYDAKHFLRTKDDPITVISFDVGFSSLTSFNRVFKEATGLCPSEFRMKNSP